MPSSNLRADTGPSSGQLNVLQDSELRTLIADYYFNTGRFGDTTDSRVDTHWQNFRRVLADTGLSAAGGETSERILGVNPKAS